MYFLRRRVNRARRVAKRSPYWRRRQSTVRRRGRMMSRPITRRSCGGGVERYPKKVIGRKGRKGGREAKTLAFIITD